MCYLIQIFIYNGGLKYCGVLVMTNISFVGARVKILGAGLNGKVVQDNNDRHFTVMTEAGKYKVPICHCEMIKTPYHWNR
jgi:biotin-(acetyl-CoA carboxylase) ligase